LARPRLYLHNGHLRRGMAARLAGWQGHRAREWFVSPFESRSKPKTGDNPRGG
jgi:hypothetical protein